MKFGWIGIGRMGSPMAAGLIGPVTPFRSGTVPAPRPRQELKGAKVVGSRSELADVDAFHHGQHREGREGGLLRCRRHVPRRRQELPSLLVDCSTIGMAEFGRGAGGPGQARREIPRRAGERQSEMRARGKSVLRRLGPAGRLRRGEAAPPRDRPTWRGLCRRGRACPHVQDRRQPDARGRQREHGGDHAALGKGGGEAQRFPFVPERQRHGVDLHALQDAGLRQPRLDNDISADRHAQGHGPRACRSPGSSKCRCRSRPRLGRSFNPISARHSSSPIRRLSSEGFCGDVRNAVGARRQQTGERKSRRSRMDWSGKEAPQPVGRTKRETTGGEFSR